VFVAWWGVAHVACGHFFKGKMFMKKSLAVLAAVAAVVGSAHAQSSVQVCGIVDVAVVKDKNVATQLSSGGTTDSRIGFKGTEDLGGGLKANFLLEGVVNIDNGASAGSTFNRQSYLGFASDAFGEVRLGKTFSAFDDVSAAAHPVFDTIVSPTKVWASNGYVANPNNTFYYASPVMGGFSAAVSYSLDGSQPTEVKAKYNVAAVNVKYEEGPVFASFAHQVEAQDIASDDKFTRLNATYDLGAAKLLAGYGRTSGSQKATDYSLGVDVPLNEKAVASVGYASSKTTGVARERGISFGAMYNLSKRTTVYGGYLNTKNSVDLATAPKSRLALGVKHMF
jgi:predicted porin